MVRGLRSCDAPTAVGKAFSQKTAVLAISMTSRAGIFWKGKVLYIARIRSFTVRMYHSMSPTCSSLDVSFNLRPSSAKPLRKGTNSPSISVVVTLNPAFRYKETTPLTHFSMVASFRSETASTVPNLMFRHSVTNKGTLLTYIRSTHKVTWP